MAFPFALTHVIISPRNGGILVLFKAKKMGRLAILLIYVAMLPVWLFITGLSGLESALAFSNSGLSQRLLIVTILLVATYIGPFILAMMKREITPWFWITTLTMGLALLF